MVYGQYYVNIKTGPNAYGDSHPVLLRRRLSVLKVIDLGQLFPSIGLQADYNNVKTVRTDYNVVQMIINYTEAVQ